MKNLLLIIILFCVQSANTKENDIHAARQQRTEWFRESRFGMFIHWGIYSIPARGEWVRNAEKLSVESYQTYFDSFNPTAFNPSEWAKAAKKAGMRYAVMTAKHHDGFCLFDSKFTDYKATNTPAERDLLKEYVDAFRAEGLKVGFYYSLLDWHHPDYPHYDDSIHPMRGNEAWKGVQHDFNRYVEYMHNQVRELCTRYGKIDIMWFDFSYGEMSGEKWAATKLVKMVRELQPGIIIDNRLGGNMESLEPEIYSGDFDGPEQMIPTEGVFDKAGRRIPWELCVTLNNNWGYASFDRDFKTPKDVIRALVNCVSKGGNLLLNVGPDAKGRIPDESLEVLRGVGIWMAKNSDSIYGCGPADLPKPEWGRYTQKGDRLYAHILEQPIGQVCLANVKDKLQSARLLRDGAEVFISDFWLGERSFVGRNDTFINFSKPLQYTFRLPDEIDTVVELTLKAKP